MQLERILEEFIQKAERRFYGKYRGIVVDNEDPNNLGRLKVTVPSVLGRDVVTGWAMPCTPFGGHENTGMLFIPEVDAGVWVEFEEGDLEFPIWVGTFWSQPDDTPETPTTVDIEGVDTGEIAKPIVTRKIIKTLRGHTIQFEDKEGEEFVTIVHRVDDTHHNVITLDANGVKITDFNSNTVTLSDTGISLKDFTENEVVMSDSEVKIVAKQSFTLDADGQDVAIKAANVEISASAIDLKKG